MKTDYFLHERRYQKLRTTNYPGWDNAEILSANLDIWEQRLQTPYLVPLSCSTGRVLELGCGAGDLTIRMAEYGFDAVGIDISPTAIAWAKEKTIQRGLDVDFQVGNVCDLSAYREDNFDLVLDGHCYHCIIGEDRRTFLEEARRVLKPSGFLLILTMCGAPDESDWERLSYDPHSRCQMINEIALRYFVTQEELIAELQQTGFFVRNQGLIPRSNTDSHNRIWVDAQKI